MLTLWTSFLLRIKVFFFKLTFAVFRLQLRFHHIYLCNAYPHITNHILLEHISIYLYFTKYCIFFSSNFHTISRCVQVLAVIVPYQGTLSGQISWLSRGECGWGKGQLGGGIGRKPDQCDLTNHWPPPCPGAQVGPHRGHHNRHMPCHHYQP